MQIIQVSPHYYPFFGGVEEVVRQYSERLITNHDGEVSVVTAQEPSTNLAEILNDVSIKRVPNIPEFFTQFQLLPQCLPAIKRMNDALKDPHDIIHIHANKRFITDVSAYLLSRSHQKFIFSPHAGQFGTSLLGRVHNQTIGKLAFKASKTIVVSEFEKNLLVKNGFMKNIVVLPNGVDVTAFNRNQETYLNHFNLEKRVKILFVGRFASSKGVDLLPKIAVEVVSRVPEAIFLLVGRDVGQKGPLSAEIKAAKLEKHFLFLEDLERDNLVSVYKNADMFVFPSRSEAFGVAVLEAMAAGLPIVASNNSAIPELIQDGHNGLLAETDNAGMFTTKLLELIKNRDTAKKLGDQARKDARDYDWDTVVARLYAIYQEVVE